MHVLSFRSILLLLGVLLPMIHALTIPNQHGVVRRDAKEHGGYDNVVDLDRRAKKKPSKPTKPTSKKADPPPVNTPTPAPPPPVNTPSKPADTPKPSPSPSKPADTPKPSPSPSKPAVTPQPSSSKPAGTPSPSSSKAASSISSSSNSGSSSSSASSSSVSSSSISAYIIPKPTKAVDTCLLPGVDCWGDFTDFDGVLDGSENDGELTRRNPNAYSYHVLEKRGDRPFDASLGGSGTLHFESLGYPAADKLFEDSKGKKLTKHGFNFTSDTMTDLSVKDAYKLPTKGSGWVVEHIVELQSVKRFIEAATTAGELSAVVPGQFFTDYWNKPIPKPDFDGRTQPTTYKGANWKKAENRTLNNLVFQALGSTYNRAEFVLCDSQINSYKERVWSFSSPMADDKFEQYTKDVVTGGITSNVHLSAIRTTLAVFSYLNNAEISKRLKQAVANVKLELANVPKIHNQNHNLDTLWEEFMKNHMEEVKDHGKEWLTKSINLAKKAYADEKKKLEAIKADLKKGTKNQAAIDKEKATLDASIKKLQTKERAAEKAVEDAEDKVAKATGAKKKTEKKAQEQAEVEHYKALKTLNLEKRKAHVLVLKNVDDLIDNINIAQKQLTGYETEVAKLKVPSPV